MKPNIPSGSKQSKCSASQIELFQRHQTLMHQGHQCLPHCSIMLLCHAL